MAADRAGGGAAAAGKRTDVVEGDVVQAAEEMSVVTALARGEINEQIATAKKYPRSIHKFRQTAETLVTANPQIAASCIYALPRKDADGATKMIKGPSIRFAEMISYAYQNIFAGGRPIAEEGGHVICQGICWDIENNVRIVIETRRKITNKTGRRYSDDMITVTSNAGVSIALRNAILHVIPKVFWQPIYEAAMKAAVGDQKTLDVRRKEAVEAFGKMGIAPARVFARVDAKGIADIDLERLELLFGLFTSIRDEGAKIDEVFPPEEVGGQAAASTMEGAIEEALDGVSQDPEVQERIREALKAKPQTEQLTALRAAKGKPEALLGGGPVERATADASVGTGQDRNETTQTGPKLVEKPPAPVPPAGTKKSRFTV